MVEGLSLRNCSIVYALGPNE